MTQVLTFKVNINNLENKIWRKIEITNLKTVAELAYVILATFDSLAYHGYKIEIGNKTFANHEDKDINFEDATKFKLKDIDFLKYKHNKMVYDFGSPTEFDIEYVNTRNLELGYGNHYPYIRDGQGSGMIDDISDLELLNIVNDIDVLGYSNYNYSSGYNRLNKYDYRKFELELNNKLLKGKFKQIKYSYEYND